MIKQYITGDLVHAAVKTVKRLSCVQEYIGHGCNCHATMGSGFAPQIASAFPDVERADREMFEKYSSKNMRMSMLGNFSLARATQSIVVLNMYTQYHPGKDLRMDALELAFFNVNNMLKNIHTGRPRLNIPMIGAGIAGGDWNEISKVIDANTPDIDVFVWVLPGVEVPKIEPSLDNINI